MRLIESKVSISPVDYERLAKASYKEVEEFVYWAAKFCTGFPTEGYGSYDERVEKSKDGEHYYVVWKHGDSCD